VTPSKLTDHDRERGANDWSSRGAQHDVFHIPTVTLPDPAVVAVTLLPAKSLAVSTNESSPSNVGLPELPTVNVARYSNPRCGATGMTMSPLDGVLNTTLLALPPSVSSCSADVNSKVTTSPVVARFASSLLDVMETSVGEGGKRSGDAKRNT